MHPITMDAHTGVRRNARCSKTSVKVISIYVGGIARTDTNWPADLLGPAQAVGIVQAIPCNHLTPAPVFFVQSRSADLFLSKKPLNKLLDCPRPRLI